MLYVGIIGQIRHQDLLELLHRTVVRFTEFHMQDKKLSALTANQEHCLGLDKDVLQELLEHTSVFDNCYSTFHEAIVELLKTALLALEQ